MFKTETIVKNSYFIAKTMNLTKTLSPFVCLGFIFQLTNLKLTDLEKKKCREMSSVNIISYFSVALNTEILLSRLFGPYYLFFV